MVLSNNKIFEWSAQQQAIFEEIRTGRRNVVIIARAGTGKTTTIVHGGQFAPERSIVYCAFNTDIAKELNTKLTNPHAKAMTIHSLGLRIVSDVWKFIKVEDKLQRGERAQGLTQTVCGPNPPEYILRLVTKLHTLGREIEPHAKRPGDLEELQYKFDCIPDDGWANAGYDAKYVELMALKAMELAASKRPPFIDFSDMIFLPVRNGWMVPAFDLVFGDEAQDWTKAQLEILRGVCRPGGRIILVGDDRQAIYGFRGADSESLQRLKVELNAHELKLTVTRRCGKVIVEEAQALVPDIEYHPDNGIGEIFDKVTEEMFEEATEGDFILSRINAPLVPIAMSLLKRGKRARIRGRNIGDGLKSLMKKLQKGRPTSVEQMLERLEQWRKNEELKWKAAERPDRVEYVNDQANMIVELSEDTLHIQDIVNRIDNLFTDDGKGMAGVITCSSVHRVKGLEADRVWVLQDTLRDRTQEEKNIQYVAITRAKKTLCWVTPGVKPQPVGCNCPPHEYDMEDEQFHLSNCPLKVTS